MNKLLLVVATGRKMTVGKISKENSAKVANCGLICACFVVLIHVMTHPHEMGTGPWVIWYFLRGVLASVAVPYFFVASGYFLARHCDENGWYRHALICRMRTLLIPFVIWNLMMYLFLSLLKLRHGTPFSLDLPTVLHVFGLNVLSPPVLVPLWFVRSLLLFIMLSPLIVLGVKRFSFGMLLLLFLVNLGGNLFLQRMWIGKGGENLIGYFLSPSGLFYFGTGCYLAFNPMKVRKHVGWFLGAIGVLLGVWGMLLQVCGMASRGYLKVLSTPFLLIGLWVIVPSRVLCAATGISAFAIYVLHSFFINLFVLCCGNMCRESAEMLLPMFAEWFVGIFGSLFLSMFMYRFLPKVARFCFGGR